MSRPARPDRYVHGTVFEPALGRYVRLHVAVFIATAGGGPWPCHFCGRPVEAIGHGVGLVHHVDRNHENDRPANLAAAHWGCHTTAHMEGRPPTDRTLEALRRGQRASPSPETRAKLRDANLVLSAAERGQVRALYTQGFLIQREIGDLFGVSQGVISRILREEPVERVLRCRRGHELTPDNTYTFRSSKSPVCKTCKQKASLASYHRARTQPLT